MKLKEKLHKRNRIYTGKAVHFSVDHIILPDGKKATREFMEHPGAVAVIPFLDKETIILVKQYRYPVREITFEIPAGKLDKGEQLIACVKRELVEETGFKATRIEKLLSFWPTPTFSDEVLHVYAATNLVPARKDPDKDEFIDHIEVPFKKAIAWIKAGKIRDSKTVIALLYWQSKKFK